MYSSSSFHNINRELPSNKKIAYSRLTENDVLSIAEMEFRNIGNISDKHAYFQDKKWMFVGTCQDTNRRVIFVLISSDTTGYTFERIEDDSNG